VILVDLTSVQLDSHFRRAVVRSVGERPSMIALPFDEIPQRIVGVIDRHTHNEEGREGGREGGREEQGRTLE